SSLRGPDEEDQHKPPRRRAARTTPWRGVAARELGTGGSLAPPEVGREGPAQATAAAGREDDTVARAGPESGGRRSL
ncbi:MULTISPECIES: hypothetical protein, partial [Streptomyces]|uniref:hypothetical protein n=1 Tax=Streptomyces TaxID=1883 RepID=UPI001AE0A0A9